MGYPKPPCPAEVGLTLAGVTRCVRDSHPLENYCTHPLARLSLFVFLAFLLSLRSAMHAHAGHTQAFGSMVGEVVN